MSEYDDDELEPVNGPYDWAEAVRRNPEMGLEGLPAEAEDQLAHAAAEEMEDWLRGQC